nr:hypothetical protein [Clostridia bacterium]
MGESRCLSSENYSRSNDTVCIDTNHILDSCKDKDCFEDVKVFLTGLGQGIIEKSTSIRVKHAHVVWTSLSVEPVQFNRGFYQVYIRFYTKLCLEACICPGKTQEFEGIAVVDKQVILYGSEGNVRIFRSDPCSNSFCPEMNNEYCSTNLPVAVCEVVDPIVLSVRTVSPEASCCSCCCCVEDIPEQVCCSVNGCLAQDTYDDRKQLLVSLGFFSVIRIERPGQYLICASEYCVPDKECSTVGDSDPCTMFKQMEFPTAEFCPPSYRQLNVTQDDGRRQGNGCGCDKHR